MKNALILFSSPHANGITSELLKFFLNSMTKFCGTNNYEFTQINTYDLVVAPCVDCGFCKVNSCCRFSDLKDMKIKFQNCNILIIATPIHNLTFPVPLKIILDRTQKYYYRRVFQKIKDFTDKKKYAILLAVGAHNDDFGVKMMTCQLQNAFTLLNTELIGVLSYLNFRGECFDEASFYHTNKNLLRNIFEKISKN